MSEQETVTPKKKTTRSTTSKKTTPNFSNEQWLTEINEDERKAKQRATLSQLKNAQQQKDYPFPTVPSSEKVDGKHVDILEHEKHLYHVLQSAGAALNKVGETATWRMHKFNESEYERFMSMVEAGDSSKGQLAKVVHKPTV